LNAVYSQKPNDATLCDKIFSDLRQVGGFSGYSGFLHQ